MERLSSLALSAGPGKQRRAQLVALSEVWRFCDLVFIKGCFVRESWLSESERGELGSCDCGRRRRGTGLRGVSERAWLVLPLGDSRGNPLLSACWLVFIGIYTFGSNSVLCWIISSVAVFGWVVFCKWILSHTLFGPNKLRKYIQR